MKTFKKLTIGLFAMLVIPVAVYLIFMLLKPAVFARGDVIYLLVVQSIESVILGWGMSFGMISGNFDLSIAAEVSLGTIVAALSAHKFGIPGLVFGAVATTMVIGLIKSLILRIIKTNAMIISIAYALILGAIGYMITTGKSLVITSEQTVLARAPWNIIVLVAMGAVMYFLHRFSRFGAHCRAVGGNAKLAASAGIDKYKTYSKSFLVASAFAGVSAIISLSRGAGASAATGLQTLTPIFSAMIGVFIGLMINRWVNVVFGIISGIMTMNIIGYGLLALGVEPDIKNTITGIFLISLMLIMAIREKRAAEHTRRELFNAQKAQRAALEEQH